MRVRSLKEAIKLQQTIESETILEESLRSYNMTNMLFEQLESFPLNEDSEVCFSQENTEYSEDDMLKYRWLRMTGLQEWGGD